MNLNFFDHFSFYLDGTLINSIDAMERSWSYVQQELDVSKSFSDYKNYIGLPFYEILKKLDLESQFVEIQKIYFKQASEHLEAITPYTDVLDFFYQSKERGKFVSIITSKPRSNTEAIINKFNIKPNLLLCGDDFHYGKPDSRLMDMAQDISGITKDKVIYFGDMLSDMLFAMNSKVSYIHVIKNDLSKIPKNLINAPLQVTNFSNQWDHN